jgi:hypothetical protein
MYHFTRLGKIQDWPPHQLDKFLRRMFELFLAWSMRSSPLRRFLTFFGLAANTPSQYSKMNSVTYIRMRISKKSRRR